MNNHFVVVEVHVKQRTDGVDHEVMRMKIMIRMKIHQQHLQTVQLLGHLEVDKQDEVADHHWKIEQNRMINGIIMMIGLVYTKKIILF